MADKKTDAEQAKTDNAEAAQLQQAQGELAQLKKKLAAAELEIDAKAKQLAEWKVEHAIQDTGTLVRESDTPDGVRVIRSKAVRPVHQFEARAAQWPSSKGETPEPKPVKLNSYLCTDPSGKIPATQVIDCCDESEARRVICAELGVRPKDVRLHIRRIASGEAAGEGAALVPA